jgi:preprotein translocase subunit YajC
VPRVVVGDLTMPTGEELPVNGWESILPFVLIVVVFWFLVVRPSRNQQKRLAATQSSVAVGSQVMLGSGIYGTVAGVGEETFDVEIAPGTTMKVAKQAVVRVVEPTESNQSPASPTDDTSASDQDH